MSLSVSLCKTGCDCHLNNVEFGVSDKCLLERFSVSAFSVRKTKTVT